MEQRTAKNLFRGYWPVDQYGYLLENQPAEVGDTILGSAPERMVIKACGGPVKEYDLNKIPALHRILAAVNPDDNEAIHGFITRFGLLYDHSQTNGDNIEEWRALISDIKSLCFLLDRHETGEAGKFFNEKVSPKFLVQIDTSSIKPSLLASPASLFGAIWFSAAGEITTGVEYSSCRQCGKPFLARSNKFFCETKCRQVWNYHHKGGAS